MDIIDDYVLRYLKVGQNIEIQYNLATLGDEWRTDPFRYYDVLNVIMKSKPLFRCERCMKNISDIHAHMKLHIEEDEFAGLIKHEDDEPSLECPKCKGIMEMTDEDIAECLPLKCKCGYKRTIKMYSDGKYLIL